ncbi:MAG: peptide-methionine (R)-S-oxide reductase MsrB [Bacteroidota bacterium]|nr:peptide-methionine (R)-S-oxide reductase MsrB [Bacteroidota bacterium]
MNLNLLIFISILSISCSTGSKGDVQTDRKTQNFEVQKSEKEWKKDLTEQQFNVLRQHETERAFSGEYNDHHKEGIYICAGCGNELFSSKTKFESGTGWPSFYAPLSEGQIGKETDNKFGMKRTEVHCARCGGHLGHVFEDGPKPTGLRYCLNSAALSFEEKQR